LKVIFLDIDGVLVNRKSLADMGGMRAKADPRCVEALNAITDATGAKIVVSSTWRCYPPPDFETPTDYMRAKMREWGVRGEVIGCTPDLAKESLACRGIYVGAERGDEIQAWLDRNATVGDEVESFVILDDDSDMKHLTDRLIKATMQHGLLLDDAERAQRMLGVDTRMVVAA